MAQNIDILIMCGGKSGSTTLNASLKKANFRTIKIHSVEDYINQFNEDKLFETIELSSKDKKLYIIDSYRNPIERKISSFFENIHIHAPKWKNRNIKELINIFNNNFLLKLEDYHSIDTLLEYYKIAQFENFDFNKKYSLIEKDNKVFIKLLHKDISDWGNILSKILNKNIEIINDNLSKKKYYYHHYQQFKMTYTVPKNYLHHIMNYDIHFRIFNSKYEQNEYIINWAKRSF